jgi:hypothetical protein
VPTVAFNFRKVRKGRVTLRIWDVAGQPKFRSMWERYCNGVDAVVCVLRLLSFLVGSHEIDGQICRGCGRRAYARRRMRNRALNPRCRRKSSTPHASSSSSCSRTRRSPPSRSLCSGTRTTFRRRRASPSSSAPCALPFFLLIAGDGTDGGCRQLDKIQDRPVSVCDFILSS